MADATVARLYIMIHCHVGMCNPWYKSVTHPESVQSLHYLRPVTLGGISYVVNAHFKGLYQEKFRRFVTLVILTTFT